MHTQIEIIKGELQNGEPRDGATLKFRGYKVNSYWVTQPKG